MQVSKIGNDCSGSGAVIVPFTETLEFHAEFCSDSKNIIETAIKNNLFKGTSGELYSLSLCKDGQIVQIILLGLGDFAANSNRKNFLNFAKAFKKCKDLAIKQTAVILDNVPQIKESISLVKKICELPHLVGYNFHTYKSNPPTPVMEKVVFATDLACFDEIAQEATICAIATNNARDYINHPSMFMSPLQLALEAQKVAEECNLQIAVYDKKQIEAFKMDTFLAVGRGAKNEPKLIVLRYMGGGAEQETIGLIGKGIMFDSGGYSIKSSMATMHGDMGGAGAVIGAIKAISQMKLPVNVVAVVAACENKIAPDAYVPGDILNSMSGKTIEMLNADAEGRLTLADAITYSIRNEKADKIIDIATLTGAAKGAVGAKTAPIVSNDDALSEIAAQASNLACEKIWRLNADEELRSSLNSTVADIKNSNPGSTSGGGTIVAGLFIQEFVEDKPWVHVDIAPVSWNADEHSYLFKGATGYGVSLLYNMVKLLSK